jgi:hypothetical protein
MSLASIGLTQAYSMEKGGRVALVNKGKVSSGVLKTRHIPKLGRH